MMTVHGGDCLISSDGLTVTFTCVGREIVTARAVPLSRALGAAVVHRATGHPRIGRAMLDLLPLALEGLPEMWRPRRRRIRLSAAGRSDEALELASRYSIVAARIQDAIMLADAPGACAALWDLVLLARSELDACSLVVDGGVAVEVSHAWGGGTAVARRGETGGISLEEWLAGLQRGAGRVAVRSSCVHGDEIAARLAALGRDVERE